METYDKATITVKMIIPPGMQSKIHISWNFSEANEYLDEFVTVAKDVSLSANWVIGILKAMSKIFAMVLHLVMVDKWLNETLPKSLMFDNSQCAAVYTCSPN